MGSGSHSSKRKKKRSKKRGKKTSKSIREKTKKLKRRHDSVSFSDDDNSASTSLVSRSDSSSEGGYRSKRRARCRDKKGTRKGSKKKMRMDSSMSDSSGDSRHIKKRKRLKSKWDFDSRKNRHRKKRRREPSSSSSDRSMSCSRSEASDDSKEVHMKDDRWELKERDEKDGEKSRTKRSRYSSRSCSPCGLQRKSHSYGSEDGLRKENPPKRLKSVIVVMREIEEAEDGQSNRDEHKDEIIYEHDDYPTRSNDSNDAVTRGEELLSSYDANDEKTMYLEEPYREVGSSDARIAKFLRIQWPGMERTDGIASSSVELRVGDHSMGNKSEVSTADVSSNSVDLEAMLRQKALQNLLKCHGRLPTKIDGGNQGDHHSKVKNPNVGGSFESTRKVGRNDDVKHASTVHVLPEDRVAHPPIRNVETGLPVEKANPSANPVISRQKLGLSTPTRRLLGASNTWRRDPTSQQYPRPTLPTPKEAVNKESAKVAESQSSDTEMVTEKADRASASELPPSGGENTEDEANEAVEDSEFEQKTMTVMRGGKLVQVSYKVKIPKKAPALARRQLKR